MGGFDLCPHEFQGALSISEDRDLNSTPRPEHTDAGSVTADLATFGIEKSNPGQKPKRHFEWVCRVIILDAFSCVSWIAYAINVMVTGFFSYSFYVIGILQDSSDAPRYILAILVGALINNLLLTVSGSHISSKHSRGLMTESLPRKIYRLLILWTFTSIILLEIGFFLKTLENYSRLWLYLWFAGGCVGFVITELLLSAIRTGVKKWSRIRESVIILADDTDYEAIESVIMDGPQKHRYVLVPRVNFCTQTDPFQHARSISAYARNNPLDHILIAASYLSHFGPRLIDALREASAPISIVVTSQFAIQDVEHFGSLALLRVVDKPLRDWTALIKWLEDKVLASLLLIFFGPLMILIAFAIWVEGGFPILFRQPRFGFRGKPFLMLKFRTMSQDACDASGRARTIRNDSRVTKVGKILRSTSIDEIPQLLNVLWGDMSLVGPRAHPLEMMVEDKFYFDALNTYVWRHRVKPGMTGWAQVNGCRGEIDTMEKASKRLTLDLSYIDSWNLWMDLRILFRTFKILVGKDVF